MKKTIFILVLLVVGFYVNFSKFDEKLRVKTLYDRVSSTPVPAQEAKLTFHNEVIGICETNGVDTINGYGTTEECLNKIENYGNDDCLGKIANFEDKIYSSKSTIKADFKVYFKCTMDIVWVEPKRDERFLSTVRQWCSGLILPDTLIDFS